jgi:hypothetical protein
MSVYEVIFYFISLCLHEHWLVNKPTWTLILCHCDPRHVYDFMISDSGRLKYPASFFVGLSSRCSVDVYIRFRFRRRNFQIVLKSGRNAGISVWGPKGSTLKGTKVPLLYVCYFFLILIGWIFLGQTTYAYNLYYYYLWMYVHVLRMYIVPFSCEAAYRVSWNVVCFLILTWQIPRSKNLFLEANSLSFKPRNCLLL